jgi:DNA-binding response OmpR family regulator
MTKADAPAQRILAIDDNAYTLRLVQQALRQAGFEGATAVSGEAALDWIAANGLPHLALVDLHMPGGMSGYEFCYVVHQYSDLPVIMLTAAGDEQTVLEGLEKHAEDYMIKPFNAGELVARVRRMLERVGYIDFPGAPLVMVDERLQVDFSHRDAVINGKAVSLTPTETKLLYLLMREAGETVTTEYILRRLWPDEPAFEDRLHVHLHRLRRKIEDKDKKRPRYITSERGKGYMFYHPAAGQV